MNFGYRCFGLYRYSLTYGTLSRSLVRSSCYTLYSRILDNYWHLFIHSLHFLHPPHDWGFDYFLPIYSNVNIWFQIPLLDPSFGTRKHGLRINSISVNAIWSSHYTTFTPNLILTLQNIHTKFFRHHLYISTHTKVRTSNEEGIWQESELLISMVQCLSTIILVHA